MKLKPMEFYLFQDAIDSLLDILDITARQEE
jgi:hypothetical protein